MTISKKLLFTSTLLAFITTSLLSNADIAVYSQHSIEQAEQGPIYTFNPTHDTQEIMDIFHKDWYWLLPENAPSEFAEFILKNRTYDRDPAHFGSLHIKVLREKENDRLVGFTAYCMETETQGQLCLLAVGRNFRGKGYGKVLAMHAMEELFKMGADHIRLWTRVENFPAQRIYRELGFKEMFEQYGYLCFEYRPECNLEKEKKKNV